MFITFEGPEGSGKSTQIQRVAAWLRERGEAVLVTREPGGTPIGDQIRRVIVELENERLVPRAEFLLFSASRAQLVEECIRPALAAGQIVLCDRYTDSTMAYQGYGHGLPLSMLEQVTEFATGGLRPELTLLLDLDPARGLERRRAAAATGAEWNRMDEQTLAFHRRVRAGYHSLLASDPARWRVVNADQPPERVFKEIRDHLASYLASPGR